MAKLFFKLYNDTDNYITAYNNISSISFTDYDRGNVADVLNWGIYSNQGSIKVVDKNNEIKNALENNYKKVEIYLSIYGEESLLKTFWIDTFYADPKTKEISINLKEFLLEWQLKKIPLTIWFHQMSLYQMLEKAKNDFNVDFNFHDEVVEKLQKISIYCPYFEESNLWNNMQKICEAGLLHICTNEKGVPTILPTKTSTHEKPIIIRPRNIFGDVELKKTSNPKLQLSVKNISKHESEVIDKEVPFEWYNLDVTSPVGETGPVKPEIMLNWQPYSANAVTGKAGNYASVLTNVNSPKYLHSFNTKPFVTFTKKTVNDNYEISEESSDSNSRPSMMLRDVVQFPETKRLQLSMIDAEALINNGSIGKTAITDGIIRVYGDYFDFAEDTILSNEISSSDGEESLQANELIQGESTHEDYGSLSNFIIGVASQLSNLSCVEVECSFSNYFDEDGKLAIDISKGEHFRRYDTVVPYVLLDGVEQPLKHETSFVVVGTAYNYDGHLTQKLMLQETREI